MDLLLHLLISLCVDLQASTGSQPPSGWCHSNLTSALVPGVGVPLMASWDLSTSSSSSMSKTDPRASAWPVFMQYVAHFGENGRLSSCYCCALNVVPPPNLMFCAQQRVPDTNRGRLRTQQIVCIVMLAPASSVNGDVKLSADD